jgi:hypothetical protein
MGFVAGGGRKGWGGVEWGGRRGLGCGGGRKSGWGGVGRKERVGWSSGEEGEGGLGRKERVGCGGRGVGYIL